MKTVDRYLVIRFMGAILKTLISMISLYIVVDLLTARNAAILRNDIPIAVVVQYYAALTPWIVGQIAPFAVLVAGLMVIGDTAQNNEVVAMMSGGISLRRFVLGPIVVVAAFAVATFLVTETIGVTAARTTESLYKSYFSRNPDFDRHGISWGNLSGGWTCHIRKFNRIALTGEDVFIHIATKERTEQIEAHRILWDDSTGQWLIEDGRWYTWAADQSTVRWEPISQRPAPFTETPETLFSVFDEADTKTPEQLKEDIEAAESRNMQSSALKVAYQAKFARPAMCFVMIWLAIPFALRLRRGGLAISFGLGILIGTAYLLVFLVSMRIGEAGRLSPVLAAWLANVAFLCGGQVLFWRTPT